MKLFLAEPFKSLWAGRDAFATASWRGVVRCALKSTGAVTSSRSTAASAGAWQRPSCRCWARARSGTPSSACTRSACRHPAAQHSFIVTEELAPTTSLEDVSLNWRNEPPEPRLKRAFIAEVARLVGMMHRAGVNHRDCYICHFLLHTDKPVTADDFRLSVIDLHRAQTRRAITPRWRNKDLAALYFSALDIGLTRRDKLRFLKDYFQKPLREILLKEASLLTWLDKKADKLYQRKVRYGDAL